jgi:hypothetical protein
MNAKEFDDMEADLKYRKHLKYSESDMDEALNQWVSVEERLPEESPYRMEYVLIVKENGVVMEAMYNTRTKNFLNRDYTSLNHSVTHWQRLPSPPE